MAGTVTGQARKRRRLSVSEKYELYLSVLTGQATQREAAEKYRVDRSTVVHGHGRADAYGGVQSSLTIRRGAPSHSPITLEMEVVV